MKKVLITLLCTIVVLIGVAAWLREAFCNHMFCF